VPGCKLWREKLGKPHGFIRLRFENDNEVGAALAGREHSKYGKDMRKIGAEQNTPAISGSCVEDAAPAFPIQGRVADLAVGAEQLKRYSASNSVRLPVAEAFKSPLSSSFAPTAAMK